MRRFLASLIIILTLVAQADEPKNEAEVNAEIWQAMVEQFKKSAVEETGKELGLYLLKKSAGDSVANYASYGLVVWSVGRSAKEYGRAKTETGKFNAAAQGVASGWMAVEPATGAFVQAAVIGMQLNAAFIGKRYMMEFLRTSERIARIYAEASEIEKQRFIADAAQIETLLAEIALASHTLNAATTDFKNECGSAMNPELESAENCLKISTQLHFWGTFFVNKVRAILAYPSLRISSAEVLTKLKIDPVELSKKAEDAAGNLPAQAQANSRASAELIKWSLEVLDEELRENPTQRSLRAMKLCESAVNEPLLKALSYSATLDNLKFESAEDGQFYWQEFSSQLQNADAASENYCSGAMPVHLKHLKRTLVEFVARGRMFRARQTIVDLRRKPR